MKKYMPEGSLINTKENTRLTESIAGLHEAMTSGTILEGRVSVCDTEHNLIVDLPAMRGIIPRIEGAAGIENGATKDIALISKVNKTVCFKIISINNGTAVLSRRAVQEECFEKYISRLSPGDIIPAKVTHLEQFGCFVDIGCGIPSLIPIDTVSVSRISHPSDRFSKNQNIRVIIKGFDGNRIMLSHKELLGTWQENAALFKTGETVSGIVRSVEDYGVFVELAPNLAGLAEPHPGAVVGQHASVYIKAIIPEKMKIKLIIVDTFNSDTSKKELNYFVKDNHISKWIYTPEGSSRIIESTF